jgi:beta-phosphoglucomutase-like phosphatase (HAD superfamily)
MSTLRAALFDLDGTLCASDHLHFFAWRDELQASAGVALDLDAYKRRISGRPNAAIGADFLPALSAERRHAVATSKEARFRELATGEHALRPLPGLLQLLSELQRRDIVCCCVTNAPRVNAEFMLKQLGLTFAPSAAVDTTSESPDVARPHFAHLIVGEECSESKPSPVPYLEAMRRISVSPQHCAVFEDSGSGIRAGCASGAKLVCGLLTAQDAATLCKFGAHVCFSDYTEVLLDSLIEHHWSAPADRDQSDK